MPELISRIRSCSSDASRCSTIPVTSAGAHDPAVARWILHLRSQHRDGVALGPVDGDELAEGLAREQWHITVGDDHLPLEVRQLPQPAGDRMTGSQLLFLNRSGHVLAERLEMFQDLDAAGAPPRPRGDAG